MRPLVSIIVPCYRQAHYLPECIGSITSQRYEHWEAIIVDDGSPDETVKVVSRWNKQDHRIRLLQKPNGGLSSARNAGLDAASGQFVQFLDADDWLPPDKLENAMQLFAQSPTTDVAYGDFNFVYQGDGPDREVRVTPTFLFKRPLHDFALRWEIGLTIPVHSFIFRAALFQSVPRRFDTTLPNHEDWAMWMRLFHARPNIERMPGITAQYRIAAGSMTRNRQAMGRGFLMAIDSLLADPNISPETQRLLREKRAMTCADYRLGWRQRLGRLLDARVIRRTVPWPIQRWLHSALPSDAVEHLEHLLQQWPSLERQA